MIAHDQRALRIVKHFRLCMTNLGAFFGLLLGWVFSAMGTPAWVWIFWLGVEAVGVFWHYRKWARE